MTESIKMIYVKDFSRFPGPRFQSVGKYSGEQFRDEVLLPAIQQNPAIAVNFDGVLGYGSSFLEEAFGGLVRKGVEKAKLLALKDNLTSQEDPTIIDEVKGYIDDALAAASR